MKRAFTLIELLVAILVLLAVLLAAGRIFSATTEVAGIGEALNDNQAELNAIEGQLRNDIASISREGFIGIRCVSLRNDCRIDYDADGTPENPSAGYLDPSLPGEAIIRSDQLVFFKHGFEGTQNYIFGEGGNKQGEGSVSRVYFGHGYQLGPASRSPTNDVGTTNVYDATPNQGNSIGPIGPWMDRGLLGGIRPMIRHDMGRPQNSFTNAGIDFSFPMPAFPADKWLLCRQSVFLGDDGYDEPDNDPRLNFAGPNFYLRGDFFNGGYSGGVLQSPSIFLRDFFPPLIDGKATNALVVSGRADSSSMEMDDIRRGLSLFADYLDGDGDGEFGAVDDPVKHWIFTNAFIQRFGLYYPHAERATPDMGRFALPPTRHVISSSCSSVKIEWTWAPGAGQIDFDGDGQPDDANLNGFLDPFESGFRHSGRTPWFPFMNEDGFFGGVQLQSYPPEEPGPQEDQWSWSWAPDSILMPPGIPPTLGQPIPVPLVGNVERFPTPDTLGLSGATSVYEATFGFNQDKIVDGKPGEYQYVGDATPWPQSLRITLQIHDRGGRLTGGRQVQFVLDLPGE